MERKPLKAIYMEAGYDNNNFTIFYKYDENGVISGIDTRPFDENMMKLIASAFDFDLNLSKYEHTIMMANYTIEDFKVRAMHICRPLGQIYPRITLYSYGKSFSESNAMMKDLISTLRKYTEDSTK